MTDQKSIATALVAAQTKAQAVAKDAENNFHRYKYASAEAIIAEARTSLSSAGLAVIPMGWELSQDRLTIEVKYRLFHTSGEYLDMVTHTAVVVEKGRPQDKAEATALTYNLGYFLRGLLLLPRVEKGLEVDARDHEPADPKALIDTIRASITAAKSLGALKPLKAQIGGAVNNGLLTDAQAKPLKDEYNAALEVLTAAQPKGEAA